MSAYHTFMRKFNEREGINSFYGSDKERFQREWREEKIRANPPKEKPLAPRKELAPEPSQPPEPESPPDLSDEEVVKIYNSVAPDMQEISSYLQAIERMEDDMLDDKYKKQVKNKIREFRRTAQRELKRLAKVNKVEGIVWNLLGNSDVEKAFDKLLKMEPTQFDRLITRITSDIINQISVVKTTRKNINNYINRNGDLKFNVN